MKDVSPSAMGAVLSAWIRKRGTPAAIAHTFAKIVYAENNVT